MNVLVFDKRTENLIELSWRFRELARFHEELTEIDSTAWKEQLCSWSNEFEEIYAEADWNSGEHGDYLDAIERFADEKIFEFAAERGLGRNEG